uniref:MFS transporter n=1 Tax=Thermogladius calderae TaxID=1200300 RepID=A0A7J3XX44_9CREN
MPESNLLNGELRSLRGWEAGSRKGDIVFSHERNVVGDRRRIFLVVSVAVLTNFLTGYNARLAIVGLPNIARDIGADIWSMMWIIQGYMLGSTFIQLVVGRLADLYGRVRLFNLGILVFTMGALASGFTTHPYILVLTRLLQGLGGAFLMNLSVTILADNIPSSMLGRWLGVTQVAWRAGAVIGLTLSGFIIDFLGWRWIFLSQIPIGLLTWFWSSKALKEVYRTAEKPRIDFAGFGLFTTSITILLISLTLIGYGYGSTSRELLITSIVLLGIFVLWELKTSSPALDLKIFKIWQFTGGVMAQLFYSIGFGASLTLLSIYLQTVEGFSSSLTGLLLIPFELAYLVSGVIGGWLSDLVGFAPITVAGLAIASTGLYTFTKLPSIITLLIGEAVFGAGAGLFVSPNTSSIMSSVPPQRRGVASSIRTLSFNIGFILSLNISILTMTRYIPYEVASQLIALDESMNTRQPPAIELSELDSAIKHSFLMQAVVMALGIPFSIARVKKPRETNPLSSYK